MKVWWKLQKNIPSHLEVNLNYSPSWQLGDSKYTVTYASASASSAWPHVDLHMFTASASSAWPHVDLRVQVHLYLIHINNTYIHGWLT